MVRSRWSFARVAAAILLLVNGIGACFGGYSMMVDPSGAGIGIPLEWLEKSPFDNFLIPGIVLFVTNGLSGFFVLLLLLFGISRYQLLVIFQGMVLFGWITAQVLMVQRLYWLHYACWGMALALIFFGWLMVRISKKQY